MFKVVSFDDQPVVKTYMDTVSEACRRTGTSCENVRYRERQDKDNDILVTDTMLVSLYYMLHGYRHNIVWLQGIVPEESFMRNHSILRYIILSSIESYVLRKADALFMVSEEMKRHYVEKYHIDFKNKVMIMPCFNELGIVPESFNVQNKYVENNFVYVGGLQEWQCFKQTVELYATIEKTAEKPTRFFVFTADRENANKILKEYSVKNYVIDWVPSKELSERIKSMKYGFVLRENLAVNNVATPTKFSNYLANGIIPIYSSCLKSFAEYNKTANVGICCDLNRIEEAAEQIITHMKGTVSNEEIKDKCESVFNDYYCAEKYINEFSERINENLRCL